MELIIAVVSGVIAVVSMIFSVFTYNKSVSRDRKQATLEAYNRLQTEVFDSLNSYMPSEIELICQDPKSTEYKILSGYLARIEHFCIGVNEKIYDDEVFYKLAHGYFDGYILRKRIEPILEEKNSKSGNELHYVNIYSILNWMDEKAKK